MNFTWTPSPNVAYQTCHVLGAWVIGLICWLAGWPEWSPIVATIGFATVKEYGFDLIVEKDTPSWDGSLQDFTFYMVGMVILAAVRGMVR